MTASIVGTPSAARAATPLPRPLAYVLGAGASHGAVQLGHLRALHEAGVRPDLIVGCSVGALNGAAFAADPRHGLARLADIWGSLRRRDVFPFALGASWRRRTVFSHTGIAGFIDRCLPGDAMFDDLPVPLHVVATDATSRRPRIISSGPIAPALGASSAIPAVFPPVTIDGVRLVDGGIRCSLPVAEAYALGAASVVALPTTHWPVPRRRRTSTVDGSAETIHGPTTVVLGGTVSPEAGWFGLSFADTDGLADRGYHAAGRQLTRLMAGDTVLPLLDLSGRALRTCRRCALLMLTRAMV